MARQNSVVDSYRFCIIGLMVIIFLSAGLAKGQLVIQPMRFELSASPGGRILDNLELYNHSPSSNVRVELTVADLSQLEDGTWETIDPNSDDVDTSKLFSCKDWIGFSQQTVDVAPMQMVSVQIFLKAPAGVYGFYSAGIVVKMRSIGEIEGVGLIFHFVIPVLVQIPGRVVQHKIELTDVGMEFRESTGEAPSTTLISMSIVNEGRTYSRLMGLVRVWGLFSEHWRKITERELQVGGILPGAKLKLEGDIRRSLPPGKYKIAGWLYVDGRRVKPIEKEIDFAGDPSVTHIATDAPLDLKPSDIVINSLPGSTRTATLQVVNASDDEVNVKVQVALPTVLRGVVGAFRGEDLDCTSWLDVEPSEFNLPSYSQQNIRIISKMPNPEAMHACYYALLGLFAAYPDGQNAGLKIANICVLNRQLNTRPMVRPGGPVGLAVQTESKYIVTSLFTNYGDIHFTPQQCRAVVTNIAGAAMSQELLRSERSGLMLPLESRHFSGELDFSNYPEGYYRLQVSLEYGPEQVATNQVGLRVSLRAGRGIIETVGREEFEKIGVKWR